MNSKPALGNPWQQFLKTFRHPGPELMDAESVTFQEFKAALKELEVINTLLGGYSVLTQVLHAYFQKQNKPYTPISFVDIGCGGGDTLRYIEKWAAKHQYPIQLFGLDLHPASIEYAQSKGGNIQYIQADFNNLPQHLPHFDFISASLFTHHLDENGLEQFLSLCKKADKGFVINDLHRHFLAFYSIWLLTSLLSKSRLVRFDARTSVWRSFKSSEWRTMLEKANLPKAQINWRWAFRWQVYEIY